MEGGKEEIFGFALFYCSFSAHGLLEEDYMKKAGVHDCYSEIE